jgi:cell division protein FtsN
MPSVHGAIDSQEMDETLNVPVRTESFSFELPQDRAVHDPNQYFVIIGSFRFSSNANSFKTRLVSQGFDPIILISERGHHRISIGSYRDEAQARAHVLQVRQNFPEYHDAWLLVRK